MGFLMLLAAFFVFRRMMWHHRGWSPRYMRRQHGPPWMWHMQYCQIQPRRGELRQLSPREMREREMSELRRRYVADEIDVEEYERGLDRVLRKH